jgi:DNA phosphorothioation-dependent restriction protein DptG
MGMQFGLQIKMKMRGSSTVQLENEWEVFMDEWGQQLADMAETVFSVSSIHSITYVHEIREQLRAAFKHIKKQEYTMALLSQVKNMTRFVFALFLQNRHKIGVCYI